MQGLTHVHEPLHSFLHGGYLNNEFSKGRPGDEIDEIDMWHEELVRAKCTIMRKRVSSRKALKYVRGSEPLRHCLVGFL